MSNAPDTAPSGEDVPARLSPTEARRVAELIGSHDLMRHLPVEALAELVARGTCVTFAPDEFLMRRGERSEFALLLMEGTADVFIETAYEDVHLATCAGPAVVGEIGAFTGAPRTAHVRARTPIKAIRIGAPDLTQAGHSHPDFLGVALGQIGARFNTFNQAVGFYSTALNALERQDFDLKLLDDLRNPLPELANFAQSFRRLAEEIMVRQAQRREMASAAAIQRAMLPEPMPSAALGHRAEIHARMQPAKEVGGDFYDMFLLPDGRLVVSVGDVSGKGTPASLFMSAVQTALRYVLRHERDLATALRIVNELLCATNREDMFVTLFCAVLDLDKGTLDYCNCGHGDSLIVRADGTLERPVISSIAVGIADHARFTAERTTLVPGERLFLFTDGLGDAFNDKEVQFGEARVEAAVRAAGDLPTADFVASVVGEVVRFAGAAPQYDDITALCLTYRGPAAA